MSTFTLSLLVITGTLATIATSWRMWKRLRFFLHMMQLEGYKPDEYDVWMSKRWRLMVLTTSHELSLALIVTLTFALLFVAGQTVNAISASLGLWILFFLSDQLYRNERPKKALAWTSRMKRLGWTAVVLTVLTMSAGVLGALYFDTLKAFPLVLASILAADFLAPYLVNWATHLMSPVEKQVQNHYKNLARKKLASMPDLTIIGITGSYGKTSVKFIVAEILKQKYNVLATPGSYNTPMGICMVVNNMLQPEHQILILEMGARYNGDIDELCEIAKPDVAIVTSVGVAHFETMGPIENIAKVKAEVIKYLDDKSTLVLNGDDDFVKEMGQESKADIWRVTATKNRGKIEARDVWYGAEGATFIVRDESGSEHAFRTRLLGEHNVVNILLGIAVGRKFGLRLRQISHAISRLEPVEHRLELKKNGEITIIDDAFNSNPVGAKNAVSILGQFRTGRRVIVTPGMIELGERQHEENRLLGKHIADHADLAILIGDKQTAPIQEGLSAGGFQNEKTMIFNSLFEAQDFLKTYLKAGDVVLYENDLPDQFNEK